MTINLNKFSRLPVSIALLLISSIWGVLFAVSGQAFGNHTLTTYRALEKMPEVALAPPVKVESIETFLKAEEKAIEKLLVDQDAWAMANLDYYPKKPEAIRFKANEAMSDQERRTAFLKALRAAPNIKLALYIEPDLHTPNAERPELDTLSVSIFPDEFKHNRFVRVDEGETVSALEVVSSGAEEPDFGIDINTWEDSPGDYGKTYGLGPLPFGNPALPYSTQAPFHMGFYHESGILYKAAPFIKRTFPLMRAHQFSTLSELAFKTGHPYWGWRFAGMALHYVQDLVQPYHSSLSPGSWTIKLLGINMLANIGFPNRKNDMIILLSNRHFIIDSYQAQVVREAARNRNSHPIIKDLARFDRDGDYPAWSHNYPRDVVSAEAYKYADPLTEKLIANLPKKYVSDPSYDFAAVGDGVDLVGILANQDPKKLAEFDAAMGELLSHFGSHTRNVIRGILKSAKMP